MKTALLLSLLAGLLSACSPLTSTAQRSPHHMSLPAQIPAAIPQAVLSAPPVPVPAPTAAPVALHSVVASDVSVRELLFALTREAQVTVHLDEDVQGRITINAVNQSFEAILQRIAQSTRLRYYRVNDGLHVQRDTPFWHNYAVDYLNIARISDAQVNVSTELAATGGSVLDGGGSGGGNSSQTSLRSASENQFWASLANNLQSLLQRSQPTADPGSEQATDDSPPLFINQEAGIVGIYGDSSQHQAVQQFLAQLASATQRQVLIEATIAEVTLNERYQSGIDWSVLRSDGSLGLDISQNITSLVLGNRPAFNLELSNSSLLGDPMSVTLSALQTFGDVSIMSSPKVMALNNQTALLKVVDNLVYFTLEVAIDPGEDGSAPVVTYESSLHTLPVGFVMTVTPFINPQGGVTLNVRPTISRIIDRVVDPNPAFQQVGVTNEIPVVQVREVESGLKVNSGDIAVIGGLMQDEVKQTQRGIPLLSRIPWLGALFRYQDDSNQKTELVIFLKPIVIHSPGLNDSARPYRSLLPTIAEPG